MRFLANENFPGSAVTTLVAAGHDVVWVRNAAPGMTDPDALAWAAHDERILRTFDKDFGANLPDHQHSRAPAADWVFGYKVPISPSYGRAPGDCRGLPAPDCAGRATSCPSRAYSVVPA